MAKNALTFDGVLPDPTSKGELVKAIKARAKAKQMEQEAKQISKKANEKIMGIMALADGKQAVLEGVGTVIMKAGKNVTYNKDAIAQYLLEKGVSAKVVGAAIEAGKRVSTYDSVEFKIAW